MGEHRKPATAEQRAKLIARNIILGLGSPHSVADLDRLPANAEFSVTFEQVWRPIKTALLIGEATAAEAEPVIVATVQ